jgi:F-type H+-transporting ATPase subunit delta
VIAGSLGRRYARALMGIGDDQKNADKLGADVRGFAQAMAASTELETILSNPAFPRADRKKIVDALATRLSVHPMTRNFLYVLLDKERLAHLPSISREIDRMLEERAGRISAEVTSATPLTAAQVTQITAKLEKLSGKKVQLTRREDPALLGGVVAKLGDVVYDGSVRSQLRKLRDQMSK